jgi:hypothetical protein
MPQKNMKLVKGKKKLRKAPIRSNHKCKLILLSHRRRIVKRKDAMPTPIYFACSLEDWRYLSSLTHPI